MEWRDHKNMREPISYMAAVPLQAYHVQGRCEYWAIDRIIVGQTTRASVMTQIRGERHAIDIFGALLNAYTEGQMDAYANILAVGWFCEAMRRWTGSMSYVERLYLGLASLREDAKMALSGEWSRADEGFQAQIELIDALIGGK